MINKGHNLNREREFTVVLESLHSDFRIFGKGLSALRDKVDGLSDRVDMLSEKVSELSYKVDGIFEMTGKNVEDIQIIKTDFKKFDKRITLLEQNFSNN